MRATIRGQAGQDAQVIDQLYRTRQDEYARTAKLLARPASTFVGLRQGRQVVSISSHPDNPAQLAERFELACLLLDALVVDQVVLLSGDETGAELIAPDDLSADLDCFMLICAVRHHLGRPSVLLTPYELSRDSRTISWGQPRGLTISETHGLWAETLVPLCFARSASTEPAALTDYLKRNREVDNDVLLLNTADIGWKE
jgi:hypothetical protein